jgi:hypothetical protein
MKTTVLKSRARYHVPDFYEDRALKAKTNAIAHLMAHIQLALEDEDIQPGDDILMDVRIKIEEAPICEDKQQKLFETQS